MNIDELAFNSPTMMISLTEKWPIWIKILYHHCILTKFNDFCQNLKMTMISLSFDIFKLFLTLSHSIMIIFRFCFTCVQNKRRGWIRTKVKTFVTRSCIHTSLRIKIHRFFNEKIRLSTENKGAQNDFYIW